MLRPRPLDVALFGGRVDGRISHPDRSPYMVRNDMAHRVYFDGNDGLDDPQGHCSYGLWLTASKADLALIPGGPQAGMIVTIYMTGEIEMEAHLEWNDEHMAWMARPIEGTVRENHEKWD